MIHGAHAIIFSKDAEADRAFFRDVLKYPFADAGYGWQIFALPPAEVAFHPSDENDVHRLYLMCTDVEELIAGMTKKGIATTPVHEERWGLLTEVTLPSGSKLGIYQPKHPSPLDVPRRPAKKVAARKKAAASVGRVASAAKTGKKAQAGKKAKAGRARSRAR
jgi:hypothetical protein